MIMHHLFTLLNLAIVASLFGAMSGSVETLIAARIFEGLGFITVVVAIPTLLLRIATPRDQRLAMAFWTTYMPAGAGSMMLIAALVLIVAVVATSNGGSGNGGGNAQKTHVSKAGQRAVDKGVWIVHAGDTLGAISLKTGIDVTTLQTLNPNLDPQTLIEGQRIALR